MLGFLFACGGSIREQPAPRFPRNDARPVLVTVDDLPLIPGLRDPAERRAVTKSLLAVLARYRIRAVALVTWSRLIDDSERALLQAWLDAGHELGNHSFSHPSFSHTPTEAFIADVENGRRLLA